MKFRKTNPRIRPMPQAKLDTRPAMNQVLVDLGRTYQTNAPAFLGSNIDAARDFLINVLAPQITALENGLQDGVEVLRIAMGEEPQAHKYFQALRVMLDHALQVKMANFIAKQVDLDPKEYELYMDLALGRNKETDTNKQLLAVSDLIKSLGGPVDGPAGNVDNQQGRTINPRQAKRNEMARLNREHDSKIRNPK